MTSIIFFGSDQYSSGVLDGLLTDSIHPVIEVVTTPPRPVGRKQVVTPSPVEIIAKEHNIKVSYYPSNKEELDNFVAALNIDTSAVGLTASFPRLLPPSLVTKFAGRLYNIHPSLLPQYRNVAPVPYAIAMGDTVTGVSIFEIGNGIDNGQIVAQADYPIAETDTTSLLLPRLFTLGTKLFRDMVTNPGDPQLTASIRVMKSADLIFTRRITRDFAYIEWPTLLKLIDDRPIGPDDTANPLIKLRLTHHPERTSHILSDLIRGLEGYEKVWSVADTNKGRIEIKLGVDPSKHVYSVLIAGKPKPITWDNFTKHYLDA